MATVKQEKKVKKPVIKKEEPVFKVPRWMDCSWKRIPCGQSKCPICGRIKSDRQKHIEKGEDPNSMESMMEDVSGSFTEALEMIKKDAEKHGFEIVNDDCFKEPPRPEKFPLYNRVCQWRNDIYLMADQADENLEAWPELESGLDILWYANTLLTKTYRQLTNRWHLDQGDDYGSEDLEYTGYVLKESMSYIKIAITDIMDSDKEKAGRFNIALLALNGLEKDIYSI
jgi:hypothetical protein